ncbi:DUF6246 family protein [Salinicola salarius]|uniref:DUF6246 family protein n=1 Tax=Salinicola salarius TaxID=430457 RepID=UPI0023E41841|nr:DUF6246 family protein [Salinicola salarius]MDF3917520.1 DUF6246 family protein [Salinicola salarius]
MANVHAGEIGITWGERDYLFRPSLGAIGSLGDPAYLGKLLARIQRVDMDGYVCALAVLSECHVGAPVDLDRLIGYYREHKGRLRYVMGSMPPAEIHILGVRLAVSGIVGEPKRRSKGSGKPSATFDPSEFVGAAQAHLGVSAPEAWQMTMIEFQRAMDAKYTPKDDEPELLTPEEAESLFDRVTSIRSKIKPKEK